jgi:endonuclease YncB( thermonuclease family)
MLIAPMGTSAASIAGAAKITDGDTVKIGGTNIRLNGIDAPETDQVCLDSSGMNYRCGIAARNALINLIGRKILTCSGREVDVYGRRIMTCFVGDIDINEAMVAEGWALAFRRYSNVYVHQEREAKRRKSGLWSGAFIAPWDWRKRDQQTEILGALTVPLDAQKRLVPLPFESSSASTGCEIKGNISRKGVRIYHTPGQRDYDRTRITEGKGERWFCTEAEARAAGWRRARN